MSVDIKLVKELRDRTNLGMNDCKKALTEAGGNIETAIDLLKKWGELKGKERESRIATEGKIGVFTNKTGSVAGIFEVNCQTDFVAKSPEFFELMDSFSTMGGLTDVFEIKRKELVAKTGENILLRRKKEFITPYHNTHNGQRTAVRCYLHPGDRLGVLVEVDCANLVQDVLDFADECAMQVAAMAPLVPNKESIPAETLVRQRRIFEEQLKEEGKPEASWQKIIEGKFFKWRKETVLLEQESIKDSKKTIEDMRQELVKKIGAEVKINRFVRYALGEGVEKKEENYLEEVAKLIK